MKRKALVCAIAALSMAASGLTVAQTEGPRIEQRGPDQARARGQDADQDRPERSRRDDRRGDYRRGDDRRYDDRRGDDRRYRDRYADERGAGPDRNFYRGGRLPGEYRNRQYVVDDWRGHRLSAPPRGYHWVQTGGDYVLAAIATGVILQILLNN